MSGRPIKTPFDLGEETLSYIRSHAITAAKELCYPRVVVEKIKLAKTKGEISRIMTNARHGCYDK